MLFRSVIKNNKLVFRFSENSFYNYIAHNYTLSRNPKKSVYITLVVAYYVLPHTIGKMKLRGKKKNNIIFERCCFYTLKQNV